MSLKEDGSASLSEKKMVWRFQRGGRERCEADDDAFSLLNMESQ